MIQADWRKKKKRWHHQARHDRKTVQVEVFGAILWVSLEILILKVQETKMKTRTNTEKKKSTLDMVQSENDNMK